MYKYIHKPVSTECSKCYKTFEPIIEWNETLDAPSSFIPNYCDECEEKMKEDMLKWEFVGHIKPNYNISFHKDNKEIGRLDFNGDKLKFEGDVEESVKKFMDYLLNIFNKKIEEIRQSGYSEGYRDGESDADYYHTGK